MEVARVGEFWDTVLLLISIPKIFSSCNLSHELPPPGYHSLFLVHLIFNSVKFHFAVLLKVTSFFTFDVLVPFELLALNFLPPEDPTSTFFYGSHQHWIRSLLSTCSFIFPLKYVWFIIFKQLLISFYNSFTTTFCRLTHCFLYVSNTLY